MSSKVVLNCLAFVTTAYAVVSLVKKANTYKKKQKALAKHNNLCTWVKWGSPIAAKKLGLGLQEKLEANTLSVVDQMLVSVEHYEAYCEQSIQIAYVQYHMDLVVLDRVMKFAELQRRAYNKQRRAELMLHSLMVGCLEKHYEELRQIRNSQEVVEKPNSINRILGFLPEECVLVIGSTCSRLNKLTERHLLSGRQSTSPAVRFRLWMKFAAGKNPYVALVPYRPVMEAKSEEMKMFFDDIDRDVPRSSFITSVQMTESEVGQQRAAMGRILKTYAAMYPDCGYYQGFGGVLAAVMVALDFDEAKSFQAFVVIMKTYGLEDCYVNGFKGTFRRMTILEKLVRHNEPKLMTHLLERCEMELQWFATRWIVSLCLDMERFEQRGTTALIDYFMMDGWVVLFKLWYYLLVSIGRLLINFGFETNMIFLQERGTKREVEKNPEMPFPAVEDFIGLNITDEMLTIIASSP